MDTIVQIMNRDHGQLTKLLIKLEKTSSNDWDSLRANFDEFKWELKRHFITEEKAIFTFLDDDSSEVHTMMLDLLKEHEVILKILKALQHDLSSKDELDLDGFIKILARHRDFEDEVFYPRLENELSDLQKKEVIKGIQSPV